MHEELRLMRERTASDMAAAGISHLRLWRGLGFSGTESYPWDQVSVLQTVDVDLGGERGRPLSSWIVSETQAEAFAEFASRVEVQDGSRGFIAEVAACPVDLVLSTARTGLGDASEAEVVLWADSMPCRLRRIF